LASTTANTFTIGDAAVGNKTYAVNDDQAASPALRFDTGSDRWFLSVDGSDFLAMAHAGSSTGLVSGTVLVGQTSGAITALGPPNDGEILIGRTGGAPNLTTLTPGTGITITNSGASIAIATTAVESGTWATVTRLKSTVYQNTTGKKLRVIGSFYFTETAASIATIQVASVNPPTTILQTLGNVNAIATAATRLQLPFYFEVPNNWYYRVNEDTGTITLDPAGWFELTE
jgi:hypothetical protein